MESGDGEKATVGRVVERIHHRRHGVAGRIRHRVLLARVFRGVVFRALLDPFRHEGNFVGRERLLFGRHFRTFLTLCGDDELEEVALGGFARHDRSAALTPFDEGGDLGHDVIGLGLRGLVAALAFRLEDRADVFVVTHRIGQGFGLLRPGQGGGKGEGGQGEGGVAGAHVRGRAGDGRGGKARLGNERP